MAFSPNIPFNTLQAANESRISDTPTSKDIKTEEVVRVGIGNQAFSSYVYKDIGLYGTSPMIIYCDDIEIETIPARKNINITINPDFSYTLKYDDGKELGRLTGLLKFTTKGSGYLGVKYLKRAGSPALYRGTLEIVKAASGNQFNLINKLPVEEYLKGVVPNEMPVTFGLEALKAQTIAARNYVLSPRTKSSANYDVVDSVASQVYFGVNTEKELSNKAIMQTEGLVALHNWDLILALYSSTAGGYTESYSHAFSDPKTGAFPSNEKPYLKAKADILSQKSLKNEADASEFYKSKPDAYDIRSPYYRWTREWSADELKSVLESTLVAQSATGFVKPKFEKGDILGDLIELKVIKRGESGKIVELEIITKTQTYKIYKELVIRRLLTKNGQALPSANVVFENIQDNYGDLISVNAFGGGFGHGVGLSQFGAGFMGSELHLPFDKILQHYYTGIIIGTKPVIISYDEKQREITQTFYANKRQANLVIDNKFQVTSINVDINGLDYSFKLPTSIIGGNRCTRIDISDYIKQGHNTIKFSYPDNESGRKALRIFVELVGNDGKDNIWE